MRLASLFLLILPLCLLSGRAAGQKKSAVHSPAELLKIMEASKLVYEVANMDSTFPCRDHSDLRTTNDAYPDKAEVNGYARYKLSKATNALLEEGESLFAKEQYAAARSKYEAIAKANPSLAFIQTYIGQTYEKEHNYSKAIQCEEQGIALNFYDYLAHYFVADNYYALGNYRRAADEIVLASILNRNNPNIWQAMRRILTKNGYHMSDWCFEPQVLVMRTDEGHISLKYAPGWLGYAIARAVWKFEPGYRQANGGAEEGHYNLREDKECLISLAYGLEVDSARTWATQPALDALHTAVEKKLFTEYLFYEVVLPRFPFAVFQLSREELEDIRKYVLDVRMQ